MSQKEFEQQDEQVIGMVNHVAPKNVAEGERYPGDCQEGCGPNKDSAECGGKLGDTEAAYSRRRILWTVLQVLSCILVAALLVTALLDPRIVVHLVNIGVLICGIVAAIVIDRHLRG